MALQNKFSMLRVCNKKDHMRSIASFVFILRRHYIVALAVIAGAWLGDSTEALAISPSTTIQNNERIAADHPVDSTGRNRRDSSPYRKTADDQSLGGSEIKTLAAIRRRIVEDDSLSTYAKNVKVIVDRSAVTLRGPVRDPIEAQILVALAYDTAPTLRIVDELEITP